MTVKMVGTMDEHPAYSSEKERTLSLEHARRLGRYLAERTIEGTLDEAEQIYGKTSQMWKEAGSVVEERDGVPRHFPPREEHQPPYIQVCIRGNPDANFDAVGGVATTRSGGSAQTGSSVCQRRTRETSTVRDDRRQSRNRPRRRRTFATRWTTSTSSCPTFSWTPGCTNTRVVNAALNLDVTDASRVRSTFSLERGVSGAKMHLRHKVHRKLIALDPTDPG